VVAAGFGAYFRSAWLGIMLSSILFCLGHDGAAGNVWGFVDLTLFGVVLAVLTIGTGGLEAMNTSQCVGRRPIFGV
jgi:membrane protease YdiL (CAAX protease family)